MANDTGGREKGLFNVIGPKFFERFKSGKRTEVGYVTDITENENGIFVNWFSTHGEPAVFVYEKGEERFKDAPKGFAVGDYIKMDVSGARILSVRPLRLNQHDKEQLSRKFKSLGEGG